MLQILILSFCSENESTMAARNGQPMATVSHHPPPDWRYFMKPGPLDIVVVLARRVGGWLLTVQRRWLNKKWNEEPMVCLQRDPMQRRQRWLEDRTAYNTRVAQPLTTVRPRRDHWRRWRRWSCSYWQWCVICTNLPTVIRLVSCTQTHIII